MIDEGKAVPMFELSDADGNIVKIKDFKGKKFVVYFYPKDFTPGCTVEADEFSKDYKKFQKCLQYREISRHYPYLPLLMIFQQYQRLARR